MDKQKILAFLPALLGFAALAVPNVGYNEKGLAASWLFGAIIFSGEFEMINFANSESTSIAFLPISGIVFAVGALLALLSALGVLKMGKFAWLPGVIMIAGGPLFFFVASNCPGRPQHRMWRDRRHLVARRCDQVDEIVLARSIFVIFPFISISHFILNSTHRCRHCVDT
jgi:hypothetical protein